MRQSSHFFCVTIFKVITLDVYIDLSLVLLVIEIMVCIYGLELLLTYREKRSVKIALIIANSILFFTIKFSLIVSLFCFFIINMTIFKLISKKGTIKFVIFSIVFFTINLFFSSISNYLFLLNIYLAINSPIGIIYALLIPLFGVIMYISTRIVDALFHLHVYKTTCIISNNEQKIAYKAYFDSGNTLKYDNVPVIFCIDSSWLFPKINSTMIEVSTISGSDKYEAYKSLISINSSNEEYFVYVVLINEIKDFYGCEVLLNAYLR